MQLLKNLRQSVATLQICGEWGSGKEEATLQMSTERVWMQGRVPQKRLTTLQASALLCPPLSHSMQVIQQEHREMSTPYPCIQAPQLGHREREADLPMQSASCACLAWGTGDSMVACDMYRICGTGTTEPHMRHFPCSSSSRHPGKDR